MFFNDIRYRTITGITITRLFVALNQVKSHVIFVPVNS